MPTSSGLRLCCILLCGLSTVAFGRDKLIVMDLVPGAEVSAEVASGLTEAVALEAARPGFYDVVSTREIQALLGAERQRQLLGCSRESECMSEIGSALGARYLLRGSVGRLGASFQLALQLVDTRKAETLSRSARLAPTVDQLRARLPYAVAEATGLPPPPPPSRIPALTALGGGAALVIGGAVLGAFSLAEEDALRREQERAVAGALATRDTYASARDRLMIQKSASLAALGVGAGLLALGVYLWPQAPDRDGLVLSVGPRSIAFAGVFR